MTDLTAAKEQAAAGAPLRRLTVTAVLAALIAVMTAYICHIPVGMNGGYVHLGIP